MSREFSTLQFAAACGLRPDRARLILRGFEETGIVEQFAKSRWIATERGLRLSRGLTLGARDPVGPPQRRRAA